MAGEFGLCAKPQEECEKLANIIATHIAEFDESYKSYFTLFVLAEIINVCACFALSAYYLFLLNIEDVNSIPTMMSNYLLSADINDPRYHLNDYMLQLFPREITCIHMAYGPSGTHTRLVDKCRVTFQPFNELFHITAFIVTTAVVAFYIINLFYIVINFMGFDQLPGNQRVKNKNYLKGVSNNTKLILIFMYNNIDRVTHTLLLEKISTPQKKSNKKNDCKQTENFINNIV